MEAPGAAGGVAVLVRDLRERDQGEHDAGRSDGSDRANLSRDVRQSGKRYFGSIAVARPDSRNAKGVGPCDPTPPTHERGFSLAFALRNLAFGLRNHFVQFED